MWLLLFGRCCEDICCSFWEDEVAFLPDNSFDNLRLSLVMIGIISLKKTCVLIGLYEKAFSEGHLNKTTTLSVCDITVLPHCRWGVYSA